LSSGVCSGQPSVEKGHNAELNQVSRTSGSWTQFPVAGRSRATTTRADSKSTVPSSLASYQAGIWWPHHSCRLMHQSWMLRIQAWKVLVHDSGTKTVRPCSTAAMAGSAKGWIFTYHCQDRRGSTGTPVRWETASGSGCGFSSTKRPSAVRSSRTFLRASKRSRPA